MKTANKSSLKLRYNELCKRTVESVRLYGVVLIDRFLAIDSITKPPLPEKPRFENLSRYKHVNVSCAGVGDGKQLIDRWKRCIVP